MAIKSQIPQSREPILDGRGGLSRTWYRFLNSLGSASGVLAEPITVPNNSIFVSGTLNAGSSLEVAPFAPGTLLGNGNTVAAAPEQVVVTGGLMLTAGGLSLAEIPANSLFGNLSPSNSAVPGAITIGVGFNIAGSVLNVASAQPGGGTFATSVAIASWGP